LSKNVNRTARQRADPAEGSGSCEPDLLTISLVLGLLALPLLAQEAPLPDQPSFIELRWDQASQGLKDQVGDRSAAGFSAGYGFHTWATARL
jgi:hypothetical protein